MSIIRQWIRDTSNLSNPSLNDLHVYVVSPEYQDRTRWVSAGCECLMIADLILKSEQLKFDLELDFCLRVSYSPGRPALANLKDLERQLDYQPPSIRLLPSGFGLESTCLDLDIRSLLDCDIEGTKAYYSETVEADEYYRFLTVRLRRS